MSPSALDPRTIDRIAEIICDLNGPYERKGRQLERLLRMANWREVPIYDRSYRVPWLRAAMGNADPSEVERLILRVCSPIEYDVDSEASAKAVRDAINEVLALQHLTVSAVGGGRFVMADLNGEGAIVHTAPADLEPRLRALLDDREVVDWLLIRIEETRICEANRAYTFALIGIASFVEYLLFAFLTQWDPEISRTGFVDARGRKTDEPKLYWLIEVAHRKGYIRLDRKEFVDKVRDYRNYVHLRLQTSKALRFDAHSVMMCWAPVKAVITDLEAAVADRRAGR